MIEIRSERKVVREMWVDQPRRFPKLGILLGVGSTWQEPHVHLEIGPEEGHRTLVCFTRPFRCPHEVLPGVLEVGLL